MATFDLDAARAARREAVKEPHTFKLGGHTYKLPIEYPMKAAVLFGTGDLDGAMKLLLEPKDFRRFQAIDDMSVDDFRELLTGIASLYGLDGMGELPASAPSSSNTSR